MHNSLKLSFLLKTPSSCEDSLDEVDFCAWDGKRIIEIDTIRKRGKKERLVFMMKRMRMSKSVWCLMKLFELTDVFFAITDIDTFGYDERSSSVNHENGIVCLFLICSDNLRYICGVSFE